MMLLLGASDALRGVFLPVLRETFALSQTTGSMLIMLSYVGNLLFLVIGGAVIGRMKRRHFFALMTVFWLSAVAAYAFTQNAFVIYCGILFSMGASTMLSTTVNLTTPLLFATPALMVNVLNFSVGLGMSASQNIGGRFAEHFSAWQIANRIILLCGGVMLALLCFLHIPEPEVQTSAPQHPIRTVFSHPAAKYLLLCVGCYCIAEHGLQNWLVTYGSEHLGFSRAESARFLSYFFIGITVGRLIFAPLVQRLGIMRSLLMFVTAAGALYITGILLGRGGIVPLCVSGFAISVLWPTTVLLIGSYYAPESRGAAVSWISGLANLFDIAFNACFGSLVQHLGFGRSILILPAAMLGCCISLYLLKLRCKQPDAEAI